MKRLKILLQHSIIYYVVLFIAIILYFVSSSSKYISVYNSFDNESFIVTGIIRYDDGVKFNLKGKEKVIGYVYDEEFNTNMYSLGDTVLITGEKKDISNNTVPNTFNYKKYLTSNKIYNVIIIDKIEKIKDNTNIFYSIKNKLIKRSEKLTKSYPYIYGLIFGVNSYIEQEVMNSYRDNGISHLFAISGLHVSLFILIISKMCNRLKIGLKSLILISFLILYMFITNFAMSVMRASIFTILLLINKLFKLKISNINLLLFALSIILFVNPLSLNNVGLQYSFIVTFALIKYSYLIRGNKLVMILKTSLISFLISYPITVNNFYQINIMSILYNLFFVPYVSFILLPMTLIAYCFPFLDNVLYFFISIIEYLSIFFEQIDFSKIILCKMSIILVIIYYLFLLRLFKKKRYSLFLIIMFFIIHYCMPFENNNYVFFFDVGQGDSSIVKLNNSVTLIDTGGITTYGDNEYSYSISKNKIIPYLKSNGIRKIDNLIITHGDFDHMGEAKYLVQNFKVKQVIFNCASFNYLEGELIDILNNKNIKYKTCINELGNMKFLQTGEYNNENDNSNVIYTEIDGYKFMFMGDAGVDKELDILDKYDISNIDILKVGHHGSDTSSSYEFIDRMNPKYSVISVGKDNKFGHPKEEVLDILNNSKIYRTDQDGSIMFKVKSSRLKIETFEP